MILGDATGPGRKLLPERDRRENERDANADENDRARDAPDAKSHATCSSKVFLDVQTRKHLPESVGNALDDHALERVTNRRRARHRLGERRRRRKRARAAAAPRATAPDPPVSADARPQPSTSVRGGGGGLEGWRRWGPDVATVAATETEAGLDERQSSSKTPGATSRWFRTTAATGAGETCEVVQRSLNGAFAYAELLGSEAISAFKVAFSVTVVCSLRMVSRVANFSASERGGRRRRNDAVVRSRAGGSESRPASASRASAAARAEEDSASCGEGTA